MKIGDREIGPHADVYIIAELGVNHDGSVERALQLTDAAAEAGADAVKLQLFKTDLLMSKAAKLAAYQKAAGERDPVAMLRRLELPIEAMARVVDRAHSRGLHAIVTVFSVELVSEAETLAWDAYKTASPDVIHRPLLEALVATEKPLIVSTGASTMDEVRRTVGWLSTCVDRSALLQCVSCYPVPVEHAALGGVRDLIAVFPGPVGYSDHTTSPRTGLAAAFTGASLLEKHITYDRHAAGPDHGASFEPSSFRDYVSHVRGNERLTHAGEQIVRQMRALPDAHSNDSAAIAELFGRQMRKVIASKFPGTKEVLPVEQDVRLVSRQSLVTRRAIPSDHRLRREDLTFKRPGTGIEPWRFDEVVGRQARRAVEADVPLTDEDLV